MCISIRGYIHEKHTHSFDAGCSAHAVRCCCIAFRLLQVGGTKRRSRKWLHRALMLGVLVVWVLYRSRPDIFQGKHPILRGLLGGETDEIWRFLCYRHLFLSVREREKINRENTKARRGWYFSSTFTIWNFTRTKNLGIFITTPNKLTIVYNNQ